MSANTGIQWTDATWNPVVGCERVSAGCDNCYAKTLHDMRHKARAAGKKVLALYDEPFETVQLRSHKVEEPLSWRKPRRVFVNSMSDLFHKDVTEDFLDRVFAVMALTPQHTYQILTKRPERMRKYIRTKGRRGLVAGTAWNTGMPLLRADGDWPLPNVWLGVSVENQACAEKRIPVLLRTPAAVRFLSCEPLLGPLDIDCYLGEDGYDPDGPGDDGLPVPMPGIDWVIVGGESGTQARVCNLEWIEKILADCWAQGVPAFVKQLGRWIEGDHMDRGFLEMRWLCSDGRVFVPPIIGSHTRTRPANAIAFGLADNHGGNPAQWPERLRVRQFPNGRTVVSERSSSEGQP